MEDTEDTVHNHVQIEPLAPCDPNDVNKPAPFDLIKENEYITERVASKEGKRNKRMMCDCQFDPEVDDASEACGENCLNRLLMIECGSRCPCGTYCNNKRFQKAQYKSVNVFKTEKKGWGLQCTEDIKKESFVMEYCGEVCTPEEFELRRKTYEQNKRRHYYFMSLKTNEIIDATKKGNLSRYINHSCDPNCETQKWTVSGKLRVGFFAVRNISAGEELTFDYKFQRFGEAAQLCYCGSSNCRGYLGVNKDPPKDMSGISLGDTKRKKAKVKSEDADSTFEREVYDIVGSSWRLRNEAQVLSLSRLMLRADNYNQRTMILKVIQSTSSDNGSLKRFLSLHGLELIWSWMVELSDQSSLVALELKRDILQSLDILPIPNRNMIKDSKILQVVSKWSEAEKPLKKAVEEPQLVISEADCSGDINQEVNERGTDEIIPSIEQVESDPVQVTTPPTLINITRDENNNIIDVDNYTAVNEDVMKGDTPLLDEAGSSSSHGDQNTNTNVGKGFYSPVDSCSSSFDRITANEMFDEGAEHSEPIVDQVAKDDNQGVVSDSVGVLKSEDDVVSVSCEAEARQTGDDNDLFDDVKRWCLRLIKKWDELEEVFKIPKKKSLTVPAKDPPTVSTKRDKSPPDDDKYIHRKRFKQSSRWDPAPPTSSAQQSTYFRSKGSGSPNVYRPSSVPSSFQPIGTRPSPLTGPAPMGGSSVLGQPPPLHNTVTIVQQPTGQSLYVQQQIFTPSSYLPPVTMTTTVEPYQQPNMIPTVHQLSATGGGPAAPLFPFVPTSGTPITNTTSLDSTPLVSSMYTIPKATPPPAPPTPTTTDTLPSNWKEATDSSGKVYYYHAITRKTQWERPCSVDEGDIMMDLETSSSSDSSDTVIMATEDIEVVKGTSPVGHPRTPDESPPPSPMDDHTPYQLQYDAVEEDKVKSKQRKTTKKPQHTTKEQQFKHLLSKSIVRCLDQHRKADCKYGRITCAEDFKHLARKLTFGLTEKEMNRKTDSSELVFTESVKSRVKEYIKSYMKKFGPVYKRQIK